MPPVRPLGRSHSPVPGSPIRSQSPELDFSGAGSPINADAPAVPAHESLTTVLLSRSLEKPANAEAVDDLLAGPIRTAAFQ